jgi:hypothetical protein
MMSWHFSGNEQRTTRNILTQRREGAKGRHEFHELTRIKGLKARKKIAQGKRSETSAALGSRHQKISKP